MEEQERLQLNIQLPAGALEGFTRLAEQLRLLAEALGGGGQRPASLQTARTVPLERGENTAFDLERFREMGQGPREPEAVRTDGRDIAGAEAARSEVRRSVEEPDGAWEDGGEAEVSAPAESAASDPPEGEKEEVPPVQELPSEVPEEKLRPEEAGGRELDAVPLRAEVEARPAEAVSAGREPDTPVPDAPAVRMEPDSQIPAAEAVWAGPDGPGPEVRAAQEEVRRALETPPGAVAELTAEPEALKSRWTGVAEELVAAGPAPLTAESVSLAFRRDGRRYDCGFPLY